jgi:hypothetical protein
VECGERERERESVKRVEWGKKKKEKVKFG